MAPVPVPLDGEVPSNAQKYVASTKPGKEEIEDTRSWMQKNKETMIGLIAVSVFALVLIIIFAAAGGGGGDGDSENESREVEPTSPSVAPTASTDETPSSAPTSFLQFLDKDNDGNTELECDTQPYFDPAGRLIFPSCNVIG